MKKTGIRQIPVYPLIHCIACPLCGLARLGGGHSRDIVNGRGFNHYRFDFFDRYAGLRKRSIFGFDHALSAYDADQGAN